MDMSAPPAAIASLVARNVVPVVGVLLLGWSAANLLLLYYVDTTLAFAVVILLVARHVTGLGKAGERGRPMRGALDWMRASFGAMLGAVLVFLPLGVPLAVLFVQFDWSAFAVLDDRSFLIGLAVQVAGSVAGCVQAHRDLLARDDDERVLKHRGAFIVARWLVVLVAAMTGFVGLFGPWIGGALMVLVYAGATVYFELLPDRALLWLNPKEARADTAKDAGRKADGGR